VTLKLPNKQANKPEMPTGKNIGVVAGAGPYAGLDLVSKILSQTIADCDQEHLTIIGLFQPGQLPDRTQYLAGKSDINPAHAIAQQVAALARAGADVAAIPCNTAHAPAIFDVVLAELGQMEVQIEFLHMIEETAHYLCRHYPHIRRLGVLSTTGTYTAEIYPQLLSLQGFETVTPAWVVQERQVQPTIYDTSYGIKATGRATVQARKGLDAGIDNLRQQGAEAIILGCTEIPLAITEKHIHDMIVIDPTLILARALIRQANPQKLKPHQR